MRWAVFTFALVASAQTIPDATQTTFTGDPVAAMVSGMERYLERLRVEMQPARKPSADKLRVVLGVVDARVPATGLEHTGEESVRWPVLRGVNADGVHLRAKGTRRGCVVAVPNVDQAPEELPAARQFAAAGYEVLSPVLLSTDSKFSGNPDVRMSKLTHREWIYRMSFPVGRHPIGYEVQKVLAAVDWFASQKCETSVYGIGDGGAIAQYAAVLDPRIVAVDTENTTIEPKSLRDEPVYRNIFGILRDFGDVEMRQTLGTRIRRLERGDAVAGSPPANADARMERQVREIEKHVQRLVTASRVKRDQLWSGIKGQTPEEWRRNAEPLAQRFLQDVLGVLPEQRVPLNLRVSRTYEEPKWYGWEVQFDVRPEFLGYGVLLVPKDLRPGEKRPLVVMQHGLQGRPQVFFGQKQGRDLEIYRNFGAQFADLGYIVYLPQNPYTGDFRHLVKMANPLGFQFYSLMRAQYAVMTDWLETLPFVDAQHIGFYGLSYGGKTALRIPPFDPRYQAVVCAGDFNEWIVKLTTPDEPWSYVYTQEYELVEWDMAHVANHAELAMLIAPRAFMVERGHRDGVGIDEWVSYEYSRVRRFYDELGIGDRTGIAFFNGPHRVDGPAVTAFLRKYLGR